ncbi:MAG TPA: TonB-dependent receptor, partial [Longimicrobiales bacterium]|nr:TonB-dependent receptor [Longimicrobiales bacterium]
ELGYGAGLDLSLPLELAGRAATLALGGAADFKDRDSFARRFRFLPVGHMSEEVAAREPDDLFTEETIGPDGFEVREATFPGDNYDATQEILAGYAMLEARLLESLRLEAGARVERTRQEVAPLERFTSSTIPLENAHLDDTDVLPGVNLTWEATGSMNLRLGLSRTLARPQFRELAPFQFTDYAGGFLTIGNPALERSRIENYDARWEWFPTPTGLLAVSAFYKRFEDPIEAVVLSSTELMQTWVNAASATNHGLELELRTSLGALGDAFEAVGVNANVTLVESEVTTGDSVTVFLPFGAGVRELALGDTRRALQGQSPWMVNLGLTWDGASGTRFSALYNHIGRRIDSVSGARLPDIYEDDRGVLDLVLEQAFGNGISAKLTAKRLLGADVVFTQGGDVVRQYDTGRVVSLSVSWDMGG